VHGLVEIFALFINGRLEWEQHLRLGDHSGLFVLLRDPSQPDWGPRLLVSVTSDGSRSIALT
jgi:hypothetical protein